jgi:hypothetical protein
MCLAFFAQNTIVLPDRLMARFACARAPETKDRSQKCEPLFPQAVDLQKLSLAFKRAQLWRELNDFSYIALVKHKFQVHRKICN